jgi:5'-nucleotidase/UDP-sugar diphosphatase
VTKGRTLTRIVATAEVRSAWDTAEARLERLHAIRSTSLVVDGGGFFGSIGGYCRLGAAALERQTALALYDVLAPSEFGWPHYIEPALHERTVCANAFDASSGQPLFHRLRQATISGRTVAVTAVITTEAFQAIPAHQRLRQEVIDPVEALHHLWPIHHSKADARVALLSHGSVDEAIKLATDCPFLDVVVAGDSSTDSSTPVQAGDTLILAGGERGHRYAVAEPDGEGWAPRIGTFPTDLASPLPSDLADLGRQVAQLRARLAAPIGGLVADRWRDTEPNRHGLVSLVARQVCGDLDAPVVVLNETAIRPVPLGRVLTLGDVLGIEPFGHQLVHIPVPAHYSSDIDGLLADLTRHVGPVVTMPDPLPEAITSVVTTDYLAENLLGGPGRRVGMNLGQAVRNVLTAPVPSVSGDDGKGGEKPPGGVSG